MGRGELARPASPRVFEGQVEDLFEHLDGFATRSYRFRRTMLQVVSHQLTQDAPQRLLRRAHLERDVGSGAVVLDHLGEPANLPFDSREAREVLPLQVRVDGLGVLGPFLLLLGWSLGLQARPFPLANRASRRLLETTLVELSAIAALASAGESKIPRTG